MKGILFFAALILALTSCGGNNSKNEANALTQQLDVTQVLYFHGKQRCITCNAIESLTKEVVDSLANEKVIMKIIDISKKENEAIADKYEVTWSSLIIHRNDKIENLTDMGFSFAKGQPQVFKAKLAESLAKIAE